MKRFLAVALVACPLVAQTVAGLFTVTGFRDQRQRSSVAQRRWDNRPIARIFVVQNCQTETNPGGYGYNPCLEDSSDPETLLSKLLDGPGFDLNAYMDNMDAMTPRPQGFLCWDCEGVQFPNEKYTGHPANIPLLQPDFDAIADDFFGAMTARGYAPGMTIRPTRQRIGQTLPPCHPYPETSLIYFHAMARDYGDRWWFCDQSTFEWTEGTPFNRTWHSEKDAMEGLAVDATYAYNRWGARNFYADSTLWNPEGGSGITLSYASWRELQRRLPLARFFPENMTRQQDFLYGAAYADPSTHFASMANLPPHPRLIFIGGTPDEDAKDMLASYVAAGAILVFDPYSSPQIAYVEEVYALAATL